MQLRKTWRLKLAQNTVLGDASLRSLGSRAKEGGNFEVLESEESKSLSAEGDKDVNKVVFSSAMESLLKREQCTGRLRICMRAVNRTTPNGWQDFLEKTAKDPPKPSFKSSSISSSDRLCLAQNLLACREILSTLSYEASLVSPGSVGNNIVAFSAQGEVVANVFPGIQISVSLEKFGQDAPDDEIFLPALSTQLKRLLFQQHISSWHNIASTPSIPTGAVQVPQKFRSAGALIAPAEKLLGGTYAGFDSLPILVASVAGFGGPAASAWMAAQHHPYRSAGGPPVQQFSAPVGQERYGYFNDWGTSQQQQQQQPGMDDVTPSSMTLSGLEHALRSSQASPAAIACVLGSGDNLLGQLINLAKHRYLRERYALQFLHS